MKRAQTLLMATAFVACGAAGADAADSATREEAFVARYLATCVETNSAYDMVAAQASAGGWTEVDPSSFPATIKVDAKFVAKRSAWKTSEGPEAITILAIKHMNTKIKDVCDIAAFDLDNGKVAEMFLADSRFTKMNLFSTGPEMAFLHHAAGNFVVAAGVASPAQKAAGHTSINIIQTIN